jgi:hypothetical protein
MGKSVQAAERDTEVGYGRTQPEFSLGERMATMEAEARKDEQFAGIVDNLKKELVREELKGVRSEMDTKDKARQDAIDKAEKAAQERAVALATELRQFTDQAQTRFGALERGGSGLAGEKLGSGGFEARALAEKAAQRSQYMVYLAVGTLGYLVATGHLH